MGADFNEDSRARTQNKQRLLYEEVTHAHMLETRAAHKNMRNYVSDCNYIGCILMSYLVEVKRMRLDTICYITFYVKEYFNTLGANIWC